MLREPQSYATAQLTARAAHRNKTMKIFFLRFFLLAWIAGGLVSLPVTADSSASLPLAPPDHTKLTYRRIFKSSSPEFIEIVVREDSNAATFEIRQLDEDPGASPFEVGATLRGKMFELAAQLNHFQGQDLDVHRRIANLGEKTFRWEQGTESHETKFNYTLNSAASQLMQIFEGLARQQELVTMLERRMKYDRLGINDALLQFETDLDHKLLPEPQRALPTLDQIAGDSRFVDIGRQRARALAERIRHLS
ncbi:MAG: hypothetical protein WBH24_07260 [Candidatus Acidiferrum sp.]|jgi:hypothetical protein